MHKNFGGKRRFNSYGDRPDFSGGNGMGKPLFSTECSNCGNFCEVPFRPVQGRPVFCRDCFKNQDQGQDRFGSERFDARPAFRKEKPFRQEKFFGESAPATSGKMSEEQFKTLNAKLDKILHILELAMQDDELDADDFEETDLEEVEEAPKPAPKKKPTRGQVKRAKRTGKKL